MSDELFPMDEATMLEHRAAPKLSYGQRLTIRARDAIAAGRHPANGLPIDIARSCGACVYFMRYRYHSRTLMKCRFHRLGESHSEASDMRASWPGCPHWAPIEEDEE